MVRTKKETETDCIKNPSEANCVRDYLYESIKNNKLDKFKDYIPIKEFGISINEDKLNIDIVAFNHNFGINNNDKAVAIECKYQNNINNAIKNGLGQALSYQTSFKKVYIAVNKKDSNPSDYVMKMLKSTGIGLITVIYEENREPKIDIYEDAKESDKDRFSEKLYKNNTFYRGLINTAFSKACNDNGYSKEKLNFGWCGIRSSKNKDESQLHLWIDIPIGDKLDLGCAYNIKIDKNENFSGVKEARLRLSVEKNSVNIEQIKDDIKEYFPIKKNRKKEYKLFEFDYNYESIVNNVKDLDEKKIKKVMSKLISDVKTKLKDKI